MKLSRLPTLAVLCMTGLSLPASAIDPLPSSNDTKRRPLSLALRGWLLSLALGLAAAIVPYVVPFTPARCSWLR